MSKKTVLIFHLCGGLGLHFLDWSLQYLAGETTVQLFPSISTTKLLSNPLVSNTAHNHHTNPVHSAAMFEQYYDASNDKLTIFQGSINMNTLLDQKNIGFKDTSNQTRLNLSNEILNENYRIIDSALNKNTKIISVTWAKQHTLVPIYQSRFLQGYDNRSHTTVESLYQEYLDLFFPGSQIHWNSTNLWDFREALALNLQLDQLTYNCHHELVKYAKSNIFEIDTKQLWFDAENLIISMFDKFEITLDKTRLKYWKEIYQHWQKVHDVKFSEDFELILDNIYAGNDFDLTSYELTLIKEALIQHGMITRYNLNFKTWQLEKFPSNTKDLHNLLEPNIHSSE